MVGVVVLEIAEHGLDVEVEPGSDVGVDRCRYIVFFYVVGVELEDAAVIAVAAGDVVIDLVAAAGYAEVVLLGEGVVVQHFLFGVPYLIEIDGAAYLVPVLGL
ncbi:hypothetical protein ACQ86N_26590 [Puia sp. P3]|uniref:hypothetical protein n=1 Tax=Puia sp. P3 TaxID=3423952 RepID=UPI003D6715E3